VQVDQSTGKLDTVRAAGDALDTESV